jgi:8-oxo-dGTP pyrophosphatase MutT (NUDIX family)
MGLVCRISQGGADMEKTTRNIAVTLECFVKKDGKYLMLHRSPNKRIMPDVWMAPGGHREFNEGLFACARREVKEETGLDIKNLRVIATGNAYLQDLKQEFFFHFVEADYAGGEVIAEPDNGELVWLTPAEMLQQKNMLAEIHEILPYLFKDDGKVVSYSAVYKSGNELVEMVVEE